MQDGRFVSLIVDPNTETRRRLQQIMTSVNEFRSVSHVQTLDAAKGKLYDTKNRTDAIFISYAFDETALGEFISEAKKTKGGADCAYVAILKDEDQGSAKAAQMMLLGADGLLFEPYSVDQLVEITKLAARVRRERAEAREQAAVNMILDEAMGTLDLLALLRSDGMEASVVKRQFVKTCENLNALDAQRLGLYLNTAVDRFAKAPLPQDIPPLHRYHGVSKRVMERIQQKLMAALERSLSTRT